MLYPESLKKYLVNSDSGYSMYHKFIKLKTVKRAIEKFGEILPDNIPIIDKFLRDNYPPSRRLMGNYEYIAHAGAKCLSHELYDLMNNRLRGVEYPVNTLEYNQAIFGKIYGEELTKLRIEAHSKILSGTSSKEYLLKKFDNDEDQYKIWKSHSVDKAKSTKKSRPYNHRENSKMCEEYYIKRGYKDYDEILQLLNIEKSKMWVNSIDAEYKAAIRAGIEYKRNARVADGDITKTRSSKAANKFFASILNLLPDEISDKVITDCNSSKEYWIRDSNNELKYYFLDFCIPNLICVEYHGRAYHPKYINDPEYKLGNYTEITSEIKWNSDRNKACQIINAGYSLLEIWDDELNVDFVVSWIKETYENRTQSLDV